MNDPIRRHRRSPIASAENQHVNVRITSDAARRAFLNTESAKDKAALRAFLSIIVLIFVANLVGSIAHRMSGGDVLIASLAALAALGPTLAILLPLLHERRFASLLGAARRVQWRAARRGALAGLGANVFGLGLAAASGAIEFTAVTATPISAIVIIVLLIAAQATGEELCFRGYLLQLCAPLAKVHPSLWAAPSLILFTMLHHASGAAWTTLIWPFVFGAAATALVWRTGGVSTAIGFHVAHNLLAILLFSHPDGVGGVGPLTWRSDAPVGLFAVLELVAALVALIWLWRTAAPETPKERPVD